MKHRSAHMVTFLLVPTLAVALVFLDFRPSGGFTVMTELAEDHIFLRGKKLYDAGELEQAVDTWKPLLSHRVYGPVVYLLAARSLNRMGRPKKAELVLKHFLKIYRGSVYRQSAKDEFLEVLCRLNLPEARSRLKSRLRKARAEDRPALLLKAAVLERSLKEYATSAKLYRDLYVNHPASVEGLEAAEGLAWLASHGKAHRVHLSTSDRLKRAKRLFRKGRFDLAAKEYRSLAEDSTQDTRYQIKLAHCLFKARRNREAIEQVNKLLKTSLPEQSRLEALYLLSKLYWRLDRDDRFRKCCKEILAAGNPAYKQRVLFNLGAYSMERGRYKEAEKHLRAVLESGASRSTEIDAKWKIAWTQYLSGQMQKARNAFRDLSAAYPQSSIRKAAEYWQARCLIQLGRRHDAELLLTKIAEESPLGYYGQLARARMRSGGKRIRIKRSSQTFPDVSLKPEHASNKLVEAAGKLLQAGLPEFALMNLRSLPSTTKDVPAIAFLIAKAAHRAHRYKEARAILSRHFRDFMSKPPADAPPGFVDMAFPRVHKSETVKAAKQYSVDPNLVWAVIRQESLYDSSGVSPAGALGLMQVTPGAAGFSPKKRPAANVVATLLDPKRNIVYGTKILAGNLRSFNGRLIPAIASYNADINKVRQWYGRRGKLASDEFVETIPYLETRLYVKKVLAGYRAYRNLHDRKTLAVLW